MQVSGVVADSAIIMLLATISELLIAISIRETSIAQLAPIASQRREIASTNPVN